MIPLRRPAIEEALGARARAYLAKKSGEAATFPPNDPRIARAWANFLGTVARRDVEEALDRYTRGKCAYCENIAAKDIEHFRPKSAYPALMFDWGNFLRGCKNCNNAKVDRFPVDDATSAALLIDPCAEEPLDYFAWDTKTGATGVAIEPGRARRAVATRDLFGLDQEPLREERRNKILDVLYLLARVVNEAPVAADTRNRLRDHLAPHRPWLGIVRQLFLRPGDLAPLRDAAIEKLPEIRDWTAAWL